MALHTVDLPSFTEHQAGMPDDATAWTCDAREKTLTQSFQPAFEAPSADITPSTRALKPPQHHQMPPGQEDMLDNTGIFHEDAIASDDHVGDVSFDEEDFVPCPPTPQTAKWGRTGLSIHDLHAMERDNDNCPRPAGIIAPEAMHHALETDDEGFCIPPPLVTLPAAALARRV